MQVVCLFLLIFFVIVNMVSVKSTINIRGISVVVDNVVQESYMIYIFIEIIILLSVNVNEYVYPGLKNGNHAKYAGL